MIIAFLAISYSLESLWVNSDANSTTFQRIIHENAADLTADVYFLRGRFGKISGDTYLYGWYKNSTEATYIIRQNQNLTVVWSRLYSRVGSYYTFDVSPSEDFLYYCQLSRYRLEIYKINATNGDAISSNEVYTFWTEWFANIGVTPSNDALYINTDSYNASTTEGIVLLRYV